MYAICVQCSDSPYQTQTWELTEDLMEVADALEAFEVGEDNFRAACKQATETVLARLGEPWKLEWSSGSGFTVKYFKNSGAQKQTNRQKKTPVKDQREYVMREAREFRSSKSNPFSLSSVFNKQWMQIRLHRLGYSGHDEIVAWPVDDDYYIVAGDRFSEGRLHYAPGEARYAAYNMNYQKFVKNWSSHVARNASCSLTNLLREVFHTDIINLVDGSAYSASGYPAITRQLARRRSQRHLERLRAHPEFTTAIMRAADYIPFLRSQIPGYSQAELVREFDDDYDYSYEKDDERPTLGQRPKRLFIKFVERELRRLAGLPAVPVIQSLASPVSPETVSTEDVHDQAA